MQYDKAFIADLLAILASAETEDQQIAAAKALANAFVVELRAASGDAEASQCLMDIHSTIVGEQSSHRVHSRHWRILHAAELVLGDQKINRR